MPEIKDSGKREVFKTGANRDIKDGKGRYDLLPFFALESIAKHFQNGAKKYGDNNYLKGIPLSNFLDSGLRHLIKFARGQNDEFHLEASAWNILCLIETKRRIELGLLPKELNDLQAELPKEVEEKLNE